MAVTKRKGQLPHGDKDPIQKIQVAHAAMMEDATATAVVSPFTTTDGSVTELETPENAVVLHLKARTQPGKWGRTSTLDGTAGQGFAILEAGQEAVIPVADGSSIFIARSGGTDCSFDFWYEILDSKTVEP